VNRYDVIIIGGGPAGLFCAIRCWSKEKRILLLEKKERCGKKLLLSGSGQCNITHEGEISGFLTHYGRNGKFIRPSLFQFSNCDLVRFFTELNIPLTTDENGKVFPESRRSQDILDCLFNEAVKKGVMIHCNEPVLAIVKKDGDFIVTTTGQEYNAKNLVIATGGMSYPATGSEGDGYAFAAALGHRIEIPAPALTPVIIAHHRFADLAGISFPDMFFSVWRQGKLISRSKGDVLFTHKGLSGPGILDNSRIMEAGDELRLSFTGGSDRVAFAQEIRERIALAGNRTISSVIGSYALPSRLVKRILEISDISKDTPCSGITVSERNRIIDTLSEFPVTIEALGDFSVAMVTKGGVALPDVNSKKMESRLIQNLFFAGEVLDIDGDTGGYNLQAAFSTGWLAGESIRKRMEKK
jgi:predicted Rossmann fold flavoprotein